jgi:UPF0755 protein
MIKRSFSKKIKFLLYSPSNIIFFTVLAFATFYYLIDLNSFEKKPLPKVIVVENDLSEKEILKDLQEKGLLKNRLSYYSLLFLSKFYKEIEPGGYTFKDNSLAAIYDSLTDPSYKYVAIQEGSRKEQIAEKFQKTFNWDEEKVKHLKNDYPLCSYSLREGYLTPGEYLISPDSKIQDIQKILKNRFEEKYEKLEQKIPNKKLEQSFTRDQIVTIASLIQREAGGKSDMRLISGIIWNRISKDMPLQIDATLQYAKGDEENWWPVPKSEDKFIESPYNTYQNEGLPPAPIANPGEAALYAAMNPINTSCLFYLHDKYRNIHCASNYKGHLANIKRYLK